MVMIPRNHRYLIPLNANATTTRFYPETLTEVPESIVAPNTPRLVAPRGRVCGVRMRLVTEAGAATTIRLQMYTEVAGSLADDFLVYDTGVLTDGVDGITLAASATLAFWIDNLPDGTGWWGNGAVHDENGLQSANARENYLKLVLTQEAAAGANMWAVSFDTLEMA